MPALSYLPFTLMTEGLGKRIAQARSDAGLTQIDLAFQLRQDPRMRGTDAKRIYEWENDARPRIPFYAVVGIARATKKPLTFFAENGSETAEVLTREALERLDRLASELERSGRVGDAAGLRGIAESVRRLTGE